MPPLIPSVYCEPNLFELFSGDMEKNRWHEMG